MMQPPVRTTTIHEPVMSHRGTGIAFGLVIFLLLGCWWALPCTLIGVALGSQVSLINNYNYSVSIIISNFTNNKDDSGIPCHLDFAQITNCLCKINDLDNSSTVKIHLLICAPSGVYADERVLKPECFL